MSSARSCSECGVVVLPGDGGVRAWGRLFCSEECADEREATWDPLEGLGTPEEYLESFER